MAPRPIRVDSNETDERAQDLLRSIGFSTYESRCYIALIGAGSPMNGYEVAKVSGVPRSAVYEALQKLVARGAAMMVTGTAEGASAFVALPVEAFVDRLRNQLSGTLDGLASVLPNVSKARSSSVVARLNGRVQVRDRFIAVMENAKSTCLMSIWPPGAEEVRDAASRLVERGVDVTSVIKGEFVGFPGRSRQHRFGDLLALRQAVGCRFYVVVADRSEALIGVREGQETWGFWSDDLTVVMLAQQFALFDVTIQEMAEALVSSGNSAVVDKLILDHHARLRHVVRQFDDPTPASASGPTADRSTPTAPSVIGQAPRKRRSV